MSEQNLRQEFEKSEHCEDLDFAWNDEFNCYADSTTQWIFQFWRDGYQVCAERKDKEIKTLLGCLNEFYEVGYKNRALTIGAGNLLLQILKDYNIIDKDGNSTPLLTGETE